MHRVGVLIPLVAFLALCGCGSSTPDCSQITYKVVPTTATADHAAAPPANQQKFSVAFDNVPEGCSVPQVVPQPNWFNLDPEHMSISSAKDATNGLATCLAAKDGPILIAPKIGDGVTVAGGALTCK